MGDDRRRGASGVLRPPGHHPIWPYQNGAGRADAVGLGKTRLAKLIDVQFEAGVARGIASRREPLGTLRSGE